MDSNLPRVSVVVGVKNGASSILASITSVLNQKDIDLELIVVDDGSTDNTRDILNEVARHDQRITVITQPAQGLTIALINGCNVASGEFLARHDDGDYSLPGRLACQAACLRQNPSATICSTHVRCCVPEGITSEIRTPTSEELADGLTGPAFHGSVMMRRSFYDLVGGYRQEFYYAQDLDLWSRLLEHGTHIVIPKILYQATVYPSSISGSHRREQTMFHRIIVHATHARRSGKSEKSWINKAHKLSNTCRIAKSSPSREAEGAYFLGACLIKKDPKLAKTYLLRAVNLNPLHVRARIRLALLK